MKKLLTVSILAALASSQAHAVRSGSDVAESDYRDYIVRFEAADTTGNTSTCGGLLVAGEYIVTAAHCVADYSHNGTNAEYQWWTDNGADNSISIYQGVNFNADKKTDTTYQVVNFLDLDETETAANNEAYAVQASKPAVDWNFDNNRRGATWSHGAFHYDIALIKLGKKISQTSHAAMLPSYDAATGNWNVQGEDTFIFRGWGKDETGQTPANMQQTELVYTSVHPTWIGFAAYIPNMPRTTSNNQACTGAPLETCVYGQIDFNLLFPTTVGGTPSTGDSGTPIEIAPNQVYALAKAEHLSNAPEWVQFTHYSWYLESMAQHINKVVAPSSMEFEFTEGKSETSTQKFAIQNLTAFNETVNLYVTGGGNVFEVSGCDTTLEPLQSCEATVTIKGAAQPANATLFIGDSNDASVALSYTATETDGSGESGTEPPTAGGSGGSGSIGFFGLLAMMSFVQIRRAKR